jgi:thioredoxin-related protein
MKSVLTTIFSFALVVSIGQGIDFFEGHWKEALEKAAGEDQLVFVDAYTTWCGPCKKMSKQVFPDPKVGEFFNASFISIKVDMESPEGREFYSKYPVSSYPTFLFINGSGEVVHKVSGFRPADPFIDVGKIAIRKDDRSAAMQEEYDNGNREFKFILKYIKALNRAGKPSLKVSNEYLLSKPKISKKQRAEFLYEATTEADSKLFDEMIKLRKFLASIRNEGQINTKIVGAGNATVLKAIDFQSNDLLEEAQNKVSKYVPSQAKEFTIESNMKYFEAIGETDLFLKEVKKYASQVIDQDAKELTNVSAYLSKEYKSNSAALKLAEKMALQSVDVHQTVEGYMNCSRILQANRKNDEAKRYAVKALALAKINGENTGSIERYVKSLESE